MWSYHSSGRALQESDVCLQFEGVSFMGGKFSVFLHSKSRGGTMEICQFRPKRTHSSVSSGLLANKSSAHDCIADASVYRLDATRGRKPWEANSLIIVILYYFFLISFLNYRGSLVISLRFFFIQYFLENSTTESTTR